MKFFTINIILFVAIWAAIFVESEARCNKMCSKVLQPVCGELMRIGRNPTCTFGNLCMLNRHRCNNPQERWVMRNAGSCKIDSIGCRGMLSG